MTNKKEHYEEGNVCPECGGILGWPVVENCSCHIRPPCEACMSAVLTCPECGWEADDETSQD